MYGCSLWSLSCNIDCALNKILRRVWNLPSLSHIGHCVSNIQSVSNCIFNSMLSGAYYIIPITCVFSDPSQCGHSFVGYNFQYGYRHLKMYFSQDMLCAKVICNYITEFGHVTPCYTYYIMWLIFLLSLYIFTFSGVCIIMIIIIIVLNVVSGIQAQSADLH